MKETDGWTSVLLALGSNEGDRHANIEQAEALLEQHSTVCWGRMSSLCETEPAGGPPQGKYINGVVELTTCLSPWALLALLQRIEAALGRVRTVRHGPRPIDLDILTYGDLVIESPHLTIPHPGICQRTFVLKPLVEIAPDRVHPVTGRTFREHLNQLASHLGEGEAEGNAK